VPRAASSKQAEVLRPRVPAALRQPVARPACLPVEPEALRLAAEGRRRRRETGDRRHHRRRETGGRCRRPAETGGRHRRRRETGGRCHRPAEAEVRHRHRSAAGCHRSSGPACRTGSSTVRRDPSVAAAATNRPSAAVEAAARPSAEAVAAGSPIRHRRTATHPRTSARRTGDKTAAEGHECRRSCGRNSSS
jgi:hypothetical protein